MNEDSISVVIPTYNRLSYLREALQSVFTQTRPADEIIVVDDGSSDGTAEALADFVSTVPLRIISQQNAGQAAARNRGILAAQGTWVAFLDSDDLWMPRKLEEQMAFLIRNPALDFVFGDMVNFTAENRDDEQPEVLDRTVHNYCCENASDLKQFVEVLLLSNPVPTPSVVFRRSMVALVGPMREDLRCSEDFDWWFRWALCANCGFLDQVVARRRLHNSNAILDRARMLKSKLQVLEDLRQSAHDTPDFPAEKLNEAIDRQRYRLACDSFAARSPEAYDQLRSISPSNLPNSATRLKWLVKLIIAKVALRS